jgi:AcrR family transcriptional regulator
MQEDSRLAGPGTRRPGGRTARTRDAVLSAALTELTEVGYADTCVERIASRAGVAVSTVYRRWRNLDGVLADLAATLSENVVDRLPDSGSLEQDLYWLAARVAELLLAPVNGAVLGSLITAAERVPAARETLAGVLEARMGYTQRLVAQAVERGEVPEDTDRFEVIRFLVAPLYYRRFITGEPLDEPLLRRTARSAAHGALSGLFRTAAPPRPETPRESVSLAEAATRDSHRGDQPAQTTD